MERKTLHMSCIQQTFVDTYYITKQKGLEQSQSGHCAFQSSSASVPQRLPAGAALE